VEDEYICDEISNSLTYPGYTRRNYCTEYEFARIPKSTLYQEAREAARKTWQGEWTTSHKAAATRQYFPTVQDRLRSKIKFTPKISGADWARDDEGILASVPPQ
jgi:hypothetical protein